MNDVYDAYMEDIQDIWDQVDSTDDDATAAMLRSSANSLTQQSRIIFTRMRIWKRSNMTRRRQIWCIRPSSLWSPLNRPSTIWRRFKAPGSVGNPVQRGPGPAGCGHGDPDRCAECQKSLQDQDSSILAAQKSAENVHRGLCLMLGWDVNAQPEIRPVPEPDLARLIP